MFWYKITLEWVPRWVYHCSTFCVLHTVIVILNFVSCSVLCPAITRKAHEHSPLPEGSQFIWTSEDHMKHIFTVPTHLSLSACMRNGHRRSTATCSPSCFLFDLFLLPSGFWHLLNLLCLLRSGGFIYPQSQQCH